MIELNEAQLAFFKTLLNNLHEELSSQYESARLSSDTVVLDQSKVGRLSRMDAMQQQKMAESTLRNVVERLRLVNIALRKMTSDDFGFCEECGAAIDVNRLEVQPEAPCCFACQSKQEYHPQS